MALADTGSLRLIDDIRIKLPRRLPEDGKRPPAASMIPNASSNDPFLAGTWASHPAPPRVGHVVNDQLGEGGIERSIRKRQLFSGRSQNGDTGMSLAGSLYEGL